MDGCLEAIVQLICGIVLLWGIAAFWGWILMGGFMDPYSIVWLVKTQPVCLIAGGGFLLWPVVITILDRGKSR